MATTTPFASTTEPTAPNTQEDTVVLPEGGKKYQNDIMITGTLGRHPELRYTPSGTPIVTFSIAHNESWKPDDEWRTKTHWVQILQFGQSAELTAQAFGKGDTVHIRGALSYSAWEDHDEKKRSKIEIKAYDVTLIKKKKESAEPVSSEHPHD